MSVFAIRKQVREVFSVYSPFDASHGSRVEPELGPQRLTKPTLNF